MNLFIFEPSNEFIRKIPLRDASEAVAVFRDYTAHNPALAQYTYAEFAGKRWTLVAHDPPTFIEGVAGKDLNRTYPAFETVPAEQPATGGISTLGKLAWWSAGLTLLLPLSWCLLVSLLSGNAALATAWFGVLPVLIGVPLGIVITLGLAAAAVTRRKLALAETGGNVEALSNPQYSKSIQDGKSLAVTAQLEARTDLDSGRKNATGDAKIV